MATSGGVFIHAILATVLVVFQPLPAMAQNTSANPEFELEFWKSISTSEDPRQFEAYLRTYPNGTFAELARLKVEQYRGQAPAAPAPVPIAPAPVVPAPVAPPQVVSAPVASAPAASVPTAYVAPAAAAVSRAPLASVAPPAASNARAPAAMVAPVTASASMASAPMNATQDQETATAAPTADNTLGDFIGLLTNQEPAFDMPKPPEMLTIPHVPIPPTFCSARERNRFHDEVYRPARRAANVNNERAIGHLRAIQTMYDEVDERENFELKNALTEAAVNYEPIAIDAYDVSVRYEAIFQRILAVRIIDCGDN